MNAKELRTSTEEKLRMFVDMKTTLSRKHRGPVDLDPHLILIPQGGTTDGLITKLPGHPNETMPTAWLMMLEKLTPTVVFLVTEAFAKPSHSGPAERGQFAKEFRTDPTTDIKELLSVTSIDIKTGMMGYAHVMFKNDDRGLPKFEDLTYADAASDPDVTYGAVPAMMSFLRDATIYRTETAGSVGT